MFDNIRLNEEDEARLQELYGLIGKSMKEIERQENLIDKFMDEIDSLNGFEDD